MKNDLFLSDLSKIVGNLDEVDGFNPHFEEYKIEEINGEKFIVGHKLKKNPFTDPLTYDKPDLLFSMVNLINSDPDEKDILNWCETYGIPYPDKELNRINQDGQYRGNFLFLKGFKYKLERLNEWFSLWKAIAEENEEKLEKIKKDLKRRFYFDVQNTLNGTNETDEITLLKQVLVTNINLKMNISLASVYNKETQSFGFTIRSGSLIDIAYYQLASLMSRNNEEANTKMKKCSSCHSLYWSNHKNSKYCPNCNRKTVWSRKQRSSK